MGKRIAGPLSAGLLLVACVARAGAGDVEFRRDIRPILSDKCFRCHGPDPGERQTTLRLDRKASALAVLESGGRAIVPGDLAASELWQRITSDDSDFQMPPPEASKPLTAEEREQIRRWIEQGANWSEHWSFVAPVRPALPAVRQRDWVRNPIDRFVLARLEQADRIAGPRGVARSLGSSCHARPDRFAADADRGRRLSGRHAARCLRAVGRSAARIRRVMVSIGRGTGWTSRVTATRTVCIWTTNDRSGLTAIG